MNPVEGIIARLTDGQRRCLLALTDEWLFGGYEEVTATILWALHEVFLQPTLVEQRLTSPAGRYPRYEHRLTPLGLAVKAALEDPSHG